MNSPTYSIGQSGSRTASYLECVGLLADWVIASGESLRAVVDAYGEFVELNCREMRRSSSEYLLEALVLGVLWRARGREATQCDAPRRGLVTELVRERRAGEAKRRDGSNAALVSLEQPTKRGRIDPTLNEIEQLLDWMLASGEYDDEVARLDGWRAFLATTQPATNREILRLVIALAVRFDAVAERHLGAFTTGVESFLRDELPSLPKGEDRMQCSRRRVEYHLNMVGAEILNRAWRRGFLGCRRYVVVMPGCARLRSDEDCRATRGATEIRCSHCTLGCTISKATRLAERMGSESVAVIHGTDFSRFLASDTLTGSDVGIVGVACASGLVGAGWRARAKGLAAQCVLLNASGCHHWQSVASPTSFDLAELGRILDRSDADECARVTPRVA
jgi:uncharacterized protein